MTAGGPDPRPLLATTEQEYSVFGKNPVTEKDPDWEEERGREEEEGEHDSIYPIITPFCWAGSGGDQEKFTCL